MKFSILAILAMVAPAAAFAPPAVLKGTPFLSKTSCPSSYSALNVATGQSVLQELLDLETAFEQDAKRNPDGTKFKGQDGPLTKEQLVKLVSVIEKAVAVEKSAGSGFDLFSQFVSGQSDEEANPQVSRKAVTTETEDSLGGSIDSKVMSFVEDLLKPKTTTPPATTDASQQSTFEKILVLLKTLLEMTIPGDFGYAQYPIHLEYRNQPLASMMKMLPNAPNQPPPFEYSFSARKIVRLVLRVVRFEVGLVLAEQLRVNDAKNSEKFYEAWFSPKRIMGVIKNPFNLVPRPNRVIKKWEDDAEMARQFLAGVNPVMIQACKDPATQLTPATLQFLADQNYDVEQLASEKRLLFADYSELGILEKNPHNAYPVVYNPDVPESPENMRYYHASQIVFELDRSREAMDIMAIELDMKHDQNDPQPQVFSRATSTKNEWLMAKTCITTADSQYHEWVSHLGNTHLTFEPHILAIHNTLRKNNHQLWDFFEPLTRDTLLLNWAARFTLAEFGPESFGDYMTSVGVGQFMQLIRNRWEKYDFFKFSALDDELAMRGFDEDFEFPGYLYREDGMKLWKAMGEFTLDFVNEVYNSDDEVAGDSVVQAWALETSDPGRAAIPGFPDRITDRATLARIMQTQWWICSGLHAAVNYPQYDYFAYVPNKPLGARASMGQFEGEANDQREWIFDNVMPNYKATRETLSTTRTLTLPSEHCIDNLSQHYNDVTYGKASYEKFLAKLDVISDEIEARNKVDKDNGNAVYNYLNPTNVPSSIDI